MDKIIDVPTPQLDKLTIANLGFLAQRRLARGVRLNHAEAVVCLFILSGLLYRAPSLIFSVEALISAVLHEVRPHLFFPVMLAMPPIDTR